METSPNNSVTEEVTKYKIEIATQTLDRNIGFVTNCDTKTSIVLTVVGVLLTIALTNDGIDSLGSIIGNCIKNLTFCSVLYLCFLSISAIIMGIGIFILGSVLIAKTDGLPSGSYSKIFFSGITKYGNATAYHEKFMAMSQDELLSDLTSEIFINATIAEGKYKKYNQGFKLTIIGLILFGIFWIIGIIYINRNRITHSSV